MKNILMSVLLLIGLSSNTFSQSRNHGETTDSTKNVSIDKRETHIYVEGHGSVLLAKIDGGPNALIYESFVKELRTLVDRAEKDPNIRAVVFTSTHPDRFLSHSDVSWLQKGGVGFPKIGVKTAGFAARSARFINRYSWLSKLASRTRLKTLLQLDNMHSSFLKMNKSGVIYIAALNGSALAIGAELALACDLRIMADGDYVFGLTEVLLALTPGGGGSQRLPRLIGRQQALSAVLEGRPFTPREALALGAVDEVVSKDSVVIRALEKAEYLSRRSKKSHGAIKRSIYFGSTMPLEKGLQLEHAEFLVRDQSAEAQELMLDYIDVLKATGELPLLDRKKYAEALEKGHIGNFKTKKRKQKK